MDPNATLAEIRQLVQAVADGDTTNEDALALAAKFDELDEWLSTGGFIPKSWDTLPSESKC